MTNISYSTSASSSADIIPVNRTGQNVFGAQTPKKTAGDTLQFSGLKDHMPKNPFSGKGDGIKRGSQRAKKWAAIYALSLTLIPTGVVSSVLGIRGMRSQKPAITVEMQMTNPDDLSAPIVITGPDAVLHPSIPKGDVPVDPEKLLPGAEINAEDTMYFARSGQVVDILQEEDDQYLVTIRDEEGELLTLNTTLDEAQISAIHTVMTFGIAVATH